MKRLQRKFLLMSAAVHGTLLLAVLVGPAFVRRPSPKEDLPVLRVIPDHLIDAALYQAPGPELEAAPVPAVPPRPAEPVTLPREAVATPRQVAPPLRTDPAPAPQPRQETVQRPVQPAPVKPAPPPKPPIRVSRSLVTRGEATPSRQPEDTARAERAQQQAARAVESQVKDALSGIRQRLSDTVVSVPGAGGMAYANYRQVVQSVYDQAWIEPPDVSRTDLAVLVEVVIRRDGKVLSDGIVRSSGLEALDRSVQAALDRVRIRGLPPFPEETRDLQRTFRIEFNLRTRRLAG